jgi:hypothetical protein
MFQGKNWRAAGVTATEKAKAKAKADPPPAAKDDS